ncbi:uncharacterized protein MUC8 [Petaurus breviceps papuanus]|uniref:uncharacterized protein MUC8 n=1 Tax=Petaurus breviceps papuanus TaxID=3040969 RepID=UPI0036D7B34E
MKEAGAWSLLRNFRTFPPRRRARSRALAGDSGSMVRSWAACARVAHARGRRRPRLRRLPPAGLARGAAEEGGPRPCPGLLIRGAGAARQEPRNHQLPAGKGRDAGCFLPRLPQEAAPKRCSHAPPHPGSGTRRARRGGSEKETDPGGPGCACARCPAARLCPGSAPSCPRLRLRQLCRAAVCAHKRQKGPGTTTRMPVLTGAEPGRRT